MRPPCPISPPGRCTLAVLALVLGLCLACAWESYPGIIRSPGAQPGQSEAAAETLGLGRPDPDLLPITTAWRPPAMPPREPLPLAGQARLLEEAPSGLSLALPMTTTLGERRPFWINDLQKSVMRQITASLQLTTTHLQMWLQEGLEVPPEDLARSAAVFEERIYPTTRAFFAADWSPGADGAGQLLVLNAHFGGAAGYFSSANQQPRHLHPYSNEALMFVMNVAVVRPGTSAYESILAHELQHMMHWHLDPNEDAWLNEGASGLAEELCGYGWPEDAVHAFLADPDLQLNTWQEERLSAQYGASYLFLRYLLDRAGPEAMRRLIAEPRNGIEGVRAMLADLDTGLSFEELYADWLVANAVGDPDWVDGRYGYRDIRIVAQSQNTVLDYPYTYDGAVHQYGAHYFELYPATEGALRVSFQGTPQVRLVPNEPTSGRYQWWSNRGDASHSSLERVFDLRETEAATLTYSLWYDIERGWDYAYVRASTDGGETWRILEGMHTTRFNPQGNAQGPGYTGKSGVSLGLGAWGAQWVREVIDLSPFCGHETLVRFDYVTDDAINKPGLCLDDIAVRAVGLYDDVEGGEGDWRAAGFLRHDNVLPQEYLVQLVTFGEERGVRRLAVGASGDGEWLLPELGSTERALLIVSAMAPGTTEQARYRLSLELVEEPGA